MKIIIVGDGKVGFAIAKQLSKEGYDITIIENKPQVLNLTMNLLDVVGIQGNGANYDVLKEAQVDQADLIIAATSSDEINIISCLMAKIKEVMDMPHLLDIQRNSYDWFMKEGY